MNSEAFLIAALNRPDVQPMLDAPAFADVPAQRPERFITVERTGGSSDEILERPVFAVQVWAKTRAGAAVLAARVAKCLRGLSDQPEVGRIRVEAVYNFPDPDSKGARYQLTVSAVLHLQD